jgi:hypothetical protein
MIVGVLLQVSIGLLLPYKTGKAEKKEIKGK